MPVIIDHQNATHGGLPVAVSVTHGYAAALQAAKDKGSAERDPARCAAFCLANQCPVLIPAANRPTCLPRRVYKAVGAEAAIPRSKHRAAGPPALVCGGDCPKRTHHLGRQGKANAAIPVADVTSAGGTFAASPSGATRDDRPPAARRRVRGCCVKRTQSAMNYRSSDRPT